MKLSKKGRAVYLEIGFWREPNGSIHMTGRGVPGFHVAVNKDPSRTNGHPTLFARLDKCLRAAAPKKKAAPKRKPRKDAAQSALSIVEQVTGGKLKQGH
jgi:hypothetical protein